MSRTLETQAIGGLRALASRFDCFIIDQFGVLHDGSAPYPGAVETLERLRVEGKQTLLLSNSGKRSAQNEARLAKLGFTPGSWTHFLSSGEVAWQMLNQMLAGQSALFCLLIARDGDRSAVDGLPLELTDKSEQADIILISASEGDRHDLEYYRNLLAPAARRGVRAICTNPDKIMLTAAGPRFGAGEIAQIYSDLGGPVTMIGKPFSAVYLAAHKLLGSPEPSRVACVGDSIEHDIAGGRQAGFSTVLVETGILQDMSPEQKVRLYSEHQAVPDFSLPGFIW